MNKGQIEAVFTNFADSACSQPLSRFEFAGSIKVTGDSKLLTSSQTAEISVDRYFRIAPMNEGFLGFLSQAKPGECGAKAWKIGEAQDVKPTGCTIIGLPPQTTTKEFEILYRVHDMLFFAARPVDGSSPSSEEKRAFALQIPLILQKK